jgi:hypothetical protein
VLADNKLALNAGWDQKLLAIVLSVWTGAICVRSLLTFNSIPKSVSGMVACRLYGASFQNEVQSTVLKQLHNDASCIAFPKLSARKTPTETFSVLRSVNGKMALSVISRMPQAIE